MQSVDIKKMIEQGITGCQASVDGDGTHFEAIVISSDFEGKTKLEQHRMVYAALGDNMKDAIHALSIRTYTPSGWEKTRQHGIN
ncbi:MAG: BolA family protein [Gammaproteobacteria bacterium]